MAIEETEEEFRDGLEFLDIKVDPAYDRSKWVEPFVEPIESEKDLHDKVDDRLRETHPDNNVVRGKILPNGSILDSVVMDRTTKLHRLLIEYKKPIHDAVLGPKTL